MTEDLIPLDPVTGLPLPSTRTIAELFEEDPLKLSDRDFDAIIAELRKDRAMYLQTGKAPTGGKGKAPKGSTAQVDLEDLLGDMLLEGPANP